MLNLAIISHTLFVLLLKRFDMLVFLVFLFFFHVSKDKTCRIVPCKSELALEAFVKNHTVWNKEQKTFTEALFMLHDVIWIF